MLFIALTILAFLWSILDQVCAFCSLAELVQRCLPGSDSGTVEELPEKVTVRSVGKCGKWSSNFGATESSRPLSRLIMRCCWIYLCKNKSPHSHYPTVSFSLLETICSAWPFLYPFSVAIQLSASYRLSQSLRLKLSRMIRPGNW